MSKTAARLLALLGVFLGEVGWHNISQGRLPWQGAPAAVRYDFSPYFERREPDTSFQFDDGPSMSDLYQDSP